MSEYITIPGRCGDAAIVHAGERIKIVNITGEQVVDTWAFNLRSPLEYMSMQHVRPDLNKGVPGPGDRLVTNYRRPVLTMLEDTSNGAHDTFMAACDIYRYMGLGVQGYHASRQAAGVPSDPLSTPPDMDRHALLMLVMGPDDADGEDEPQQRQHVERVTRQIHEDECEQEREGD